MPEAFCIAYKLECLRLLAGKPVKLALYTNRANLGALTEAYSPENEVSGEGYEAGGQLLSGLTISSKNETAWARWSDAVWPLSKITARWGLLYRSDTGSAVRVVDLSLDGGDVISNNGEFRVALPSSGRGVIVI